MVSPSKLVLPWPSYLLVKSVCQYQRRIAKLVPWYLLDMLAHRLTQMKIKQPVCHHRNRLTGVYFGTSFMHGLLPFRLPHYWVPFLCFRCVNWCSKKLKCYTFLQHIARMFNSTPLQQQNYSQKQLTFIIQY